MGIVGWAVGSRSDVVALEEGGWVWSVGEQGGKEVGGDDVARVVER